MILKKRKRVLFLGKNLDYLLAQHALDIKKLSIKTKVPAATIARMRKQGTNPTLSSLEPLLDFFDMDMDSFLYEDMTQDFYKNKKKIGKLSYVPIFSLEDAVKDRTQAKALHFIGIAGIAGENIFGIIMNSDSLAPTFQNNATLILDPDLKPQEGSYVLCTLGDDEAAVIREILIDGNNFFFKPINPNFGEIKNYKKYQIIGVIIENIKSYR